MSSTWCVALGSQLLIAAVSKSVKLVVGIVVAIFLLYVIYLMLRSMGFDRSTPPSLIFRKLGVFFSSFFKPTLLSRKLKQADELHESGKVLEALDIYIQVYYFDGMMMNSNEKIAIHNDSVLQGIEEICEQTSYEFPSERLNRFEEDIFDYFLVKTKYLSPADYDGSPLHRPENEGRFKEKLNLTQEQQLIEGFQQFLTTLVKKLTQHIKSGAQVLPRGTKTSKPKASAPIEAGSFAAEVPAPEPASPFGSQPEADPNAEIADPFGGASMGAPQEAPAPPADPFAGMKDPFGGSAAPQGEIADPFGGSDKPAGPVSAPDGLFGGGGPDVNPFSIDDPHDPFNDSTGVMHKLPGAADDLPPPPAAPAPPAPPIANGPAQAPPMAPQPTGGFPGLGAPGAPGIAPPPQMSPQPTGGFPGLASPTGGLPQATGGFPGLGPSQPTGSGPAPSFPQPTGGFPGFQGGAPTGTGPAAAPTGGFPQPTGGFPGFQGGNPPPPPALGGGFPQPTGGFPPAGGAGFPQPTGGFPGIQGGPGGAGFPQPTGGFPGFQGGNTPAPVPPNPFDNDKNK